jgi:hypothetical protein
MTYGGAPRNATLLMCTCWDATLVYDLQSVYCILQYDDVALMNACYCVQLCKSRALIVM